jgi:hypothetical protein
MPYLLLALLLLQTGLAERLFEKAIDNIYRLTLVRNAGPKDVIYRLRIEERAPSGRWWELAAIPASHNYKFVRADSSSVVLLRSSDYGFAEGYVKLFFDLASKKAVKTIEFSDPALTQIADAEAQRILGTPVDFVRGLKAPFQPKPLPPELLAAPLPQSTLADFKRARPSAQGARIREMIEPYQIEGNRIWFGKSFYDGEGYTGVGAIGYFDRPAKKFAFLRIPEVVDWSVSNLLVEGDTLWAGLVRHPEGADQPGGLIRHDLKSGNTKKYAVDDVIYRIQRWNDALYLTTSTGIYVLRADRMVRYRVEPDINGKTVLISEQL